MEMGERERFFALFHLFNILETQAFCFAHSHHHHYKNDEKKCARKLTRKVGSEVHSVLLLAASIPFEHMSHPYSRKQNAKQSYHKINPSDAEHLWLAKERA